MLNEQTIILWIFGSLYGYMAIILFKFFDAWTHKTEVSTIIFKRLRNWKNHVLIFIYSLIFTGLTMYGLTQGTLNGN